MSRRLLYLLAGVALLAVTGIAIVLLTRPAGTAAVRPSALSGSGSGPYRGSEPPPGIHAPEFALSDVASNRVVRMGDLRGKVVLVTFLDTKCVEMCPIIAGQIGLALDRLDAEENRRTAALAITVDPTVDTPASVRRFLRRHRVAGRLAYLSGRIAELRPIWDAFHIVPALDTQDADVHSADVRVFDPRGIWVATLHAGVDLTPANLAHDIAVALQRR